ncbi:MAG: hypothetical protein WC107_04295 [Patescibacteria group bacterium]
MAKDGDVRYSVSPSCYTGCYCIRRCLYNAKVRRPRWERSCDEDVYGIESAIEVFISKLLSETPGTFQVEVSKEILEHVPGLISAEGEIDLDVCRSFLQKLDEEKKRAEQEEARLAEIERREIAEMIAASNDQFRNRFSELVGKTVSGLELSGDQTGLCLRFTDGSEVCWEAAPGCWSCAEAWWNDGIGVENLFGTPVTEVLQLELPNTSQQRVSAVAYGVQFRTSKGVTTFAFRGNHEHYGASIEIIEKSELDGWSPVQDDWG